MDWFNISRTEKIASQENIALNSDYFGISENDFDAGAELENRVGVCISVGKRDKHEQSDATAACHRMVQPATVESIVN